MLDAIEAAQNQDVRVYGLRYMASKHGRLTARNKYGMRIMQRIAKETGAADYDARQGDLAEWLREIKEELRSSYDLAYPSTNPARDGSFRKITLRVKREGLVARAKPGYFAESSPQGQD